MTKISKPFILLFVLLINALIGYNDAVAQSTQIPIIPFNESSTINIDGDLADWNKHNNLFAVDQFISAWGNQNFGRTLFKAFHDKSFLYFYFDIKDDNIVEKKFEREEDVGRGDRGEIFLSADSGLTNYYCFEISPSAKVLDYKAKHYRKFDYEWDLKGLEVKSKVNQDGYILEGKIPMEFIKGLMASNSHDALFLGLFRGEFDSMEWDEKTINWISWIRPTSKKPDFHIPSAFKKVQFGQ